MPQLPAIPGFRLQHRLARGRHGEVWSGVQDADGMAVAVKVVAAGQGVEAARFLREAATLAGIAHAHVVRCLGSGEAEGALWLAMELAAGDLATEVRSGPSPATAVLEAGRDAALGLAAVHARGLAHRDLTPANLLRMADGRVVIGDFGLVTADHEHLTRDGEILGTPAYLSPEQAGGRPVDVRADIYALGAVLFALATGQPPYRGDGTWGLLGRIAAGPFPDPRELEPGIMPQLRAIIRAATALRPEDRYQEAAHLAEDCAAVLAGGIPRRAGEVRARWAAPAEEAPAAAPPRPRWLAPAAGAAAGLAFGLVLGWLLTRPDPQERADYAAAATAGDGEAWRRYARNHPGGPGRVAAERALAALDAAPAAPAADLPQLERTAAQLEAEIARLRAAGAAR